MSSSPGFCQPSQASATLPISAVIIAKDAAASIGPCLESLRFCAEILVVLDADSQDATGELATAQGARVLVQPWLGFGAQKQWAVMAARHDWVLCVDTDERVSPELAASLAALWAGTEPPPGAYRFARCNRFLGRYLRHGEGYPDWSLRFFHRQVARWSDDRVHEKVLVQGEVITLSGDLLHDSADRLDHYVAKQNRYSSLGAEAAYRAGRRSSGWQVVASPLARFLRFYLFKGGFRDGLPGFVHIAIGCFASFAKHAKLLELQRRSEHPVPPGGGA